MLHVRRPVCGYDLLSQNFFYERYFSRFGESWIERRNHKKCHFLSKLRIVLLLLLHLIGCICVILIVRKHDWTAIIIYHLALLPWSLNRSLSERKFRVWFPGWLNRAVSPTVRQSSSLRHFCGDRCQAVEISLSNPTRFGIIPRA